MPTTKPEEPQLASAGSVVGSWLVPGFAVSPQARQQRAAQRVDPGTGGGRMTYPRTLAGDPDSVPGCHRGAAPALLVEAPQNPTAGLDCPQDLAIRIEVPELADLFDGSERLLGVLGSAHYARDSATPENRTAPTIRLPVRRPAGAGGSAIRRETARPCVMTT